MDQYIYQVLKNQLAIMECVGRTAEPFYPKLAIEVGSLITETQELLDKLKPGGGYWVEKPGDEMKPGKGYYVGPPIVRPVD